MSKRQNKIKPSHNVKVGRIIQPSSQAKEKEFSFSFKYLDVENKKFDFSQKKGKYFISLLKRLKEYSCCSHKYLAIKRSDKHYRYHPIRWEETSEPKGFSNIDEQFRFSEAYEFSQSGKERFHGIPLDGIFYIIWLDPNHLLYPGR